MSKYTNWDNTSVSYTFNRAIGNTCVLSSSVGIIEPSILEAKEDFKNFVRYYNNKINLNPQQELYKNYINNLLIMLDNYEFTNDKTEINNYICKNCKIVFIQI